LGAYFRLEQLKENLMRAKFALKEEVSKKQGDQRLCFQYGVWTYSDKHKEYGYRFTWRKPNGNMLTRGQARIPSMAVANELMNRARHRGWGNY
jgi:hypothetical protein